ncbi:TPA: putative addiction module antidote protein [Salmonella enterica subsp. enterica serovar Typhi str. CT18]|jgi:probable addiction module antidote protein|uniref:addiction module antidote protein n=1 Tax=Enterobacterales TaxID=91347 RepID=UPI0010347A9B|nr:MULTISPECIES: addiction module antidote protein [Enterobacterales]HCK6787737.1 putative addiction module antidote protein [Salmonella enterica subsp. enterica serovar Typhi str. CT18]HEB0918910.1 putative addiction module antidote protein [Enterobacter cloacae]EKC9670476.1 putative addiction module antidote protein [Escherichia coli]EKN4689534.1 putative addiction module antidote protein [Yersinia ruckeri]MBL0881548.1 putative addiction module antidote protein [Serratia ureilytica]
MKLKEYDIAEHLNSEEEMQMYLNEIMEDGEPSLVLSALGDIARARNMSQLSREVGMSREGLYHALSGKGNPTFSAMMKITKALGLKLHFTGA